MERQTARKVTRTRGRQVKIWLTESEYVRLKSHATAGDETLASFIRRVVRLHLARQQSKTSAAELESIPFVVEIR
jgi:hypothetical protein